MIEEYEVTDATLAIWRTWSGTVRCLRCGEKFRKGDHVISLTEGYATKHYHKKCYEER